MGAYKDSNSSIPGGKYRPSVSSKSAVCLYLSLDEDGNGLGNVLEPWISSLFGLTSAKKFIFCEKTRENGDWRWIAGARFDEKRAISKQKQINRVARC